MRLILSCVVSFAGQCCACLVNCITSGALFVLLLCCLPDRLYLFPVRYFTSLASDYLRPLAWIEK